MRWEATEELLALLLEELSVLSSDRRREQPITVPRPGQTPTSDNSPGVATGVDAIAAMAGFAGRVMVVETGDEPEH